MIHEKDNVLTDDKLVIVRGSQKNSKHAFHNGFKVKNEFKLFNP